MGRRLPYRGGPGRDRGPGGRRHLSAHRLRPRGRRWPHRDRDLATRAGARLCGPRREPERRTVRPLRRANRAHARVPRAGAGRGARARRPREGHRRRPGLHVRRCDRRGVVARPRAARPCDRASRRHARCRALRRTGVGVPRRRRGQRRHGAARGQGRQTGAEADRRAAPRRWLARRQSPSRCSTS